MYLKELFPSYNGVNNPLIKGLCTNSKEVKKGDLFLCIKGLTCDRHKFLSEAIAKGAVAAVVSQDINSSIPLIKVEDVNKESENIALRFYNNPLASLKLIGVTGTDGKTSTATYIQQLLGEDKCGYIGTNGVSCAKYKAQEVHNTTPDKLHLYKYFAKFRDCGCQYVSMEASSEAFYYQRLKGITFDYAAISNVTSEHLNTHKTLENYIACKQQLFIQNKGISILNKDDNHYQEFAKIANNIQTYGKDNTNTLQIVDYQLKADSTIVTLKYKEKEYTFTSPLLASFNVENLAEALLVVLNCGYKMEDLITKVNFLRVAGRMQVLKNTNNFTVVVDYAHTPNGIKRCLEFFQQIKHHKLITISGQAGERDKTKRPLVGKTLLEMSDYVYLTSEDPRHEKVEDIIKDMLKLAHNYNNYEIVIDRGLAIKKAIKNAKKDDIIIILGKGSETTQTYGDKDVRFSDVEYAKQELNLK